MKLIKDYINKRVLQEIYEVTTLACEKIIMKDFIVAANCNKASELYDELRLKLLEFDKVATSLDECLLADERCEKFGE
jgi:hypothetical protein